MNELMSNLETRNIKYRVRQLSEVHARQVGDKVGSYLNHCHMQPTGLFCRGSMKKQTRRILLDSWCKSAKSYNYGNNVGNVRPPFYNGGTYKVAPYKLLIHGADDHKNDDSVPTGSETPKMKEPAAGGKKKSKQKKEKQRQQPICEYPVAANSNAIGLTEKSEQWLDLATLVIQQEQLLLSRQTKK